MPTLLSATSRHCYKAKTDFTREFKGRIYKYICLSQMGNVSIKFLTFFKRQRYNKSDLDSSHNRPGLKLLELIKNETK